MAALKLLPSGGINNVKEDAALRQDGRRTYLRDAVNVDISPMGKIDMRRSEVLASDLPYRCLWQSPLHGDVFAQLNGKWVKVNPDDWTNEDLADCGMGEIYHEVLNNRVIVSTERGLLSYDGGKAVKFTIDTPPAPAVSASGDGSLTSGHYGVAISWLDGEKESALSEMTSANVTDGRLNVTLPMVLADNVTAVRLYATRADGGELLLIGEYPKDTLSVEIALEPDYGRAAAFRHLAPMPAGKYLKYWRGRLLSVQKNVLYFSEANAYHLHDERHGFVQFGQRITFMQPVDGGVWVGQRDHVVFLAGSEPKGWVMQRKSGKAPVLDSAILVPAEVVGSEISQGGMTTAIWLAENGYVIGTATGSIIELHSGIMKGISAQSGMSVRLDERVWTAVK